MEAYFIQTTGKVIDILGVSIIVLGGIISSVNFIHTSLLEQEFDKSFKTYQQNLGKVILLGLEFLVAADIIGSVAVSPTFTSVGILAIIVLIRTFLSIGLRVEIEGRWPWQKEKSHLTK